MLQVYSRLQVKKKKIPGKSRLRVKEAPRVIRLQVNKAQKCINKYPVDLTSLSESDQGSLHVKANQKLNFCTGKQVQVMKRLNKRAMSTLEQDQALGISNNKLKA